MTTEAVARPAATILLLRDGADGLEVFMVVRHHAIDFASGALVFPGGRVDRGDHEVAAQPALCPNPNGLPVADMAFRIAAIRETFEECGVLLARPAGSDRLVDPGRLTAIEAAHRAKLAAGDIGFDRVLAEHELLPATDLLVHYAHWITPSHQPKRYDTQFFLAAAPAEHLAVHDGSESVDSVWISPRQALADTEAGRFKLVFATMKNLEKLSRHATVAEALATARASRVATVQPRSTKIDATRRKLIIPAEAGYGGPEFIVDLPPAS
jgi:8-oxo-dGTP pyrophosphatase MutT (NUDIX family)